ncbi:MAG: transposase [Dehalococcoidales bacterium]|nr:transposase [Dehalococcoidales bacterium]
MLCSPNREKGTKQRSSEEQIIQILQEAEAAPTKIEVCGKYAISEWTYYRWRQQYQGLNMSQARRLKALEQENERFKRLAAEQMLANAALKAALVERGLQ